MSSRRPSRRALAAGVAALGVTLVLPATAGAQDAPESDTAMPENTRPEATLVGRAVLPADTFAEGPTSGRFIGEGPFGDAEVPFVDAQPVQGFSAVLRNEVDGYWDGTYLVMSDNGFGGFTNSADYLLRVYTIRPYPTYADADGNAQGWGTIEVEDVFTLSDPDGHIAWTITNQFTEGRRLTGADFDIESFRRAPDGTYWFGDEFGPFLLHTDADGVLIEPPISLPDPSGEGDIRAPENPYSIETAAIRWMNAARTHAELNGSTATPVLSPNRALIVDTTEGAEAPDPSDPEAIPDVVDVTALHAAGHPVIPWTVNDPAEMARLMDIGVDGIISDRADLLYEVVAGFDADGDGTAGDYLLDDGRIDAAQFDAQGHRGARDLAPENTLPAMEAGLDHLMTTLETDTGVTADGVSVLDHDPAIGSATCRHADGSAYGEQDEVLIKDLTAAEIQARFVCDGVIRDDTPQTADPAATPVAAAFAADAGIDPYVMPTVDQLFDFVDFYVAYYTTGAGASTDGAAVKAANAAEVRFNIETKIHATAPDATRDPQAFVDALAGTVAARGMEERVDIQSFDWRTLLLTQEQYPAIRTAYLLGGFPAPEEPNTPEWTAGMFFPTESSLGHPFTAQGSGGFEGMALNASGTHLYPLLEKPLLGADGEPGTELLISEFDLAAGAYTDAAWTYPLNERGSAIGDFTMFSDTEGLVIERDSSQGDLDGFKAIYRVTFGEPGTPVTKELVVDLLDIADPHGLATGEEGDVGVGGGRFAFPFVTIEDVAILRPDLIAVLNDNNYPFSIGRHVGSDAPDDNELVLIELAEPLFD
ncbi:MAG: esterase-like activity of phytase family protein [Actinomycetota bacterium]|nr:esterase-like activity of phytase family protein [Actinomycetota bacterium]